MILGKISVKPFEPKTATPGEDVSRKKTLRDFINYNIPNIGEIKNSCKSKDKVSLDVCFNLYDGDKKNTSRYDKDLDNLLKIVLDVLPDYMDNKQENRELGLGIINDDNQVFEIHSYKKFTQDLSQEGIYIVLSDYNS